MSLRDLKPGDRFTAEFEVKEVYGDGVRTTSTNDICFADEGKTIVNVTKLPPRARPVRKGDTVKPNSSPVTTTFLTTWENQVVIWRNGYGSDVYGKEYVTHADGAPIDWEASE